MLSDELWPEAESCHVHDKASLREFQPFLCRWKRILAGDDPNSVEQQMLALAWDDTVYRCFNEALRLTERNKSDLSPPGTLVELIHKAFFANQVMLIRRLFDYRSTKSGKEVYSIRTVMGELRDHQSLITRENYVCYDGTPYEASKNSSMWREERVCLSRHAVFDTLSLTDPKDRNRSDLLDGELLVNLETHLRADDLLRKYVNKYLAHGADPSNRASLDPKLPQISLRYLQRLYRMLIWACKLLGKMTDQLVLTEVPVPQFDQFMGWSPGFIRESTKHALFRYWQQRARFFDKWSTVYWDSSVLYRSPYGISRIDLPERNYGSLGGRERE